MATLWWRGRHRPNDAWCAWLVGLGCYTIGVACQAAAELGTFTPLLYRVWYLTGAFFVAAYLGAGSLYLAAPRSIASWAMRGLVWCSILVTPPVMTAPLDLGRVDPRLLTGEGFPEYVRLLTPFFNVFGTLALVGGAVWSAVRRRSLALALIAVGSLATASGATLLRFGVPGGFYVGQMVGIVVMWSGYALTRTPARLARPSAY